MDLARFAALSPVPVKVTAMRIDDLQMLHRQLRKELDAAYAARPWDGPRIDRIAVDLLQLERSLALCESDSLPTVQAEVPADLKAVPAGMSPPQCL
jgi:hypothetical protein